MPSASTEHSRILVRTPEDLLALVPVLLGFNPAESVTLLGLTGGPSMHARVDLPEDPDQVPTVVAALLRPCVRHGVRRVRATLGGAPRQPERPRWECRPQASRAGRRTRR